jgi:putative ABC transport system substrate-binding protein
VAARCARAAAGESPADRARRKTLLQRELGYRRCVGDQCRAVAGGVIGYGVHFPDMFRRAATFVDKILKGAKPADLPVERATKFETIVNLKIAKALGLEVPTATLLRADQVVE